MYVKSVMSIHVISFREKSGRFVFQMKELLGNNIELHVCTRNM